MMTDIRSKDLKELEEIVLGYGESKFRAKQIFEWLHRRIFLKD